DVFGRPWPRLWTTQGKLGSAFPDRTPRPSGLQLPDRSSGRTQAAPRPSRDQNFVQLRSPVAGFPSRPSEFLSFHLYLPRSVAVIGVTASSVCHQDVA